MWKRNSSGTPAGKVSERLIPIGEIVATHGIEGWLKLKPYNPDTAIFSATEKIFLEKEGVHSPCLLEATRAHKGQFLLKLRGIEGIANAQKWVGSILCVEEELLQPLSPGEYYYYQTVGLEVFDTRGGRVGTIKRIWSKPGGDLYVVQGEAKEYLIPAVKEIIEKIDLPGGKIIINLPSGLLDL